MLTNIAWRTAWEIAMIIGLTQIQFDPEPFEI